MRRTTAALFCVLVLVIAACVPSLHPLLTEEDYVFEEALLGTWAEADSAETWTFTRGEDAPYKLVYVDGEGKRGEFDVSLGALDGRLFLDLFPQNPPLEANDFYKAHLVPAHTFMLVRSIEPTLELASIDVEWLDAALEEDASLVRYEKVQDTTVLTAPTKELQEFVLRLVDNDDAWGELSLIRKTVAASIAP